MVCLFFGGGEGLKQIVVELPVHILLNLQTIQSNNIALAAS